MSPIKPTPLWIQRTKWTYRGQTSRWPPRMTRVMPRPEKTVRYRIHLNPRNKALRGRSAATMDLPTGCKNLVEPTFRHLLKLISRKLCSSGGNALMLPSQRRINSTSNGRMPCSTEEQVLTSQHIKASQNTLSLLTWGSDLWRKSILPRTTSLLPEVLPKQAVKNSVSGSKTDRMACRKFSRSTSKKATNQKAFSWLRLFLITT